MIKKASEITKHLISKPATGWNIRFFPAITTCLFTSKMGKVNKQNRNVSLLNGLLKRQDKSELSNKWQLLSFLSSWVWQKLGEERRKEKRRGEGREGKGRGREEREKLSNCFPLSGSFPVVINRLLILKTAGTVGYITLRRYSFFIVIRRSMQIWSPCDFSTHHTKHVELSHVS